MAYTTAGSYVLPLTVTSNPARSNAVKVPASVIVSIGSKTAIFVITTSSVSSEQQVIVTTQYNNQPQSATFYLEP
jgi:aspartate/methionine/tyrosine aminotransferase